MKALPATLVLLFVTTMSLGCEGERIDPIGDPGSSLQGTVTDSITGIGIPRVLISVGVDFSGGGNSAFDEETDETGGYFFSLFPPPTGNTQVRFSKVGYLTRIFTLPDDTELVDITRLEYRLDVMLETEL